MANLSNLLTGQSNLVTDQDLAAVATSGSYTDLTNKPTIPSGSYTDLTNKPTLATVATTGSYSDLTNKPTLATVATTGSYTDLSNKPVVISLKGTAVTYPGDDLAADPAGAQTITITGTGFESTPTVYIGGTIAPSVSFVSSTQITVTTPAKAAGTYDVYIVNPGGATAIMVYGVSYSGTPAWTTAAGNLGTVGSDFTVQLQASGDAPVTYALTSGSTLPSGVTLSSAGLITGSALSTDQTFSFSVTATDAQRQDTPRSFQVTIALSDLYFKYVTLLLTGDGANGAQNNTFLDSSTNNFTITRNGNTTQGSFSPYGSNWSNYFDATGYLTTANTSALKVGTGDFTVEFWAYWIYQDTSSYYAVTAMGTNSLNIQNLFGNFNVQFQGIAGVISFSLTPYYNSWNHFAVVRQSGTTKVYVNGSVVATASDTNDYQGSDPLNIGLRTGGGYLNSYISNLRVCKSAVYTSTFTPSTAPLTTTSQGASNCTILTCQSNRFIDNSTSALVFTVGAGTPSVQRFNPFGASTAYSTSVIGGSGYFDGSGDTLQATAGAVPAIGTGNFTLSGWWYLNELKNYQIFFDFRNGTNAEAVPYLYMGSTGLADYYLNGSSNNLSINFRANEWSYVVVSRVSGTTKIFINGAQALSISDSTNYVAGRLNLGFNNSGGTAYYYNGYIADFKLVIGTGTTSGTPTTAPATATSGTQALLSMQNGAIFDNAMMNDLETLGNSQISTSVVKYGTGSLAFDGTGDYLKIPYSPNLQFGTGAYTFEFWLNTSSVSQWLVFNAETDTGIRFYVQSDGTLELDEQVANVDHNIYSTATVNDGAWHHIALSRASGAGTKMFVDGVYQSQQAAVYNFSNASPYYIGVRSSLSGYLTGYIDDLRITKGFARYTANFTPPTAAHKQR